MTVVLIIFTAINAFLVGFFVGVKKNKRLWAKKITAKTYKDLQIIKTEFENFLNYDGSVQQ